MQKLVPRQKKIVVSEAHGKLDVRELQKKAPELKKHQVKFLEEEIFRVRHGHQNWNAWNTPISEYALPLVLGFAGQKLNAERYLEAVLAKNDGDAFRILDVGIGLGAQWRPFIERHPEVEFYCTSLRIESIQLFFTDKLVVCGADVLDTVFPHDYFNVIFSHQGMHGDEFAAIFPISNILSKGGEAVINMALLEEEKEAYKKALGECKSLQLLGFESARGYGTTVHLRKLA